MAELQLIRLNERQCIRSVETHNLSLALNPDVSISILQVVAGFAENQKYGLGTNSMTSSQKNLIIWGTLAFFFVLFIGESLGYRV